MNQDSDITVLTNSEVQIILSSKVNEDSQVKVITETENQRDLQERKAIAPVTECLSDAEDRNDRVSNTTESTPDIFKSPDRVVTAHQSADIVTTVEIAPEVQPQTKKWKYQGVMRVEETQLPDKSSDSEDDRPIVITLRQEKVQSLSAQQIQDCKEGPVGETVVGVTIAKTFDGVEFRGTIDSFRTARKRFYYHVTYTDGDEEELSQRELRDGYVLGLSKEIE
jgi:hypothetical protein